MTEVTTLELWMVRHGETTYGAERRIAGWADPPLSAKGEDEARALRDFFDGQRFDSTWSSDLRRAITTSELAWGAAKADCRLREIDFGDLEGTFFDAVDHELATALLGFREFEAPSGESLEQTRQRVLDFVEDLAPGRHLLFVHGGVIRLLAQDLGVDRFVPNSTVVGIDWTNRQLLFVHEPAT